jgi:hypothetical protein
VRYQNLPRASEEYDDPDHDYVSTSEWASGSGSDTETEPNSLPVDIEGLSDIDSIAHTRTHHIHQWEEGHYSPILGYLDQRSASLQVSGHGTLCRGTATWGKGGGE